MTTRMSLAALWTVLAALAACKHPDIGKPCDDEKDCEDGLICDVHDGKGTCQEAHGHEAGEEEETTAGTSGGATGATTGAMTHSH